jgi:hypothetical protein
MTGGVSDPLVTVDDRWGRYVTVAARTQRGPGPGDFLRARDNPGARTTWTNARRRLLTCAIG